jgi:hypothetical protein
MLGRDGSDLHEEIKLKAFPYKNCGPQMLSGSFWKKMQKLWTAILKCRIAIFGLAARTCSFKAVISLELIDFDTLSFQTSLN